MLPIVYSPVAEKYLKKIKERALKQAYKEAIFRIRENPEIGELKKGDLRGVRCVDIHYGKVGYELAYLVSETDSGPAVVVLLAGTRENFYKQLKKHMK